MKSAYRPSSFVAYTVRQLEALPEIPLFMPVTESGTCCMTVWASRARRSVCARLGAPRDDGLLELGDARRPMQAPSTVLKEKRGLRLRPSRSLL